MCVPIKMQVNWYPLHKSKGEDEKHDVDVFDASLLKGREDIAHKC